LAGVRAHGRRLAATALAIVLGVAFLTTTVAATERMERGVQEQVAAGVADRDLVVTDPTGELAAEVVDALRREPALEVIDTTLVVPGRRGGDEHALAVTPPRGPGVALLSGHWPDAEAGTVALSVTTARAAGLDVGDEVTFVPDHGPAAQEQGPRSGARTARVAGLMDVGQAPHLLGQDVLVVPEPVLRGWAPASGYREVLLDAAAGTDPATARAAVEQLAPGAIVRSGPEEARQRVAQSTGGSDVLGSVLLGFGAVALCTTALVIANTFAIVLAQRVRELALLRCVGATRRQLRRSVLVEAALLGSVASAAGVLTGLGAAWGLARLVTAQGWELAVDDGFLLSAAALWPWLAGLLITVLAAWWPTRRATAVPPVHALHPGELAAPRSRAGTWRLAAGVVLLLAGAAGLALAVSASSVTAGIAGGVLSFLGVLVLAVWLVPWLIRALGRLAGRGVPRQVALDGVTTAPGRAAAASAALLVGVTLVTMTTVGAATAERTALLEIDAANPVDVLVTGETHWEEEPPRAVAVPGHVATELAGLDEVRADLAVPGAPVSIEGGGLQEEALALGVDPAEAAPLLRDPAALAGLSEGTVGAPADLLAARGLPTGTDVTVTGPDGATTTARVVPVGLDHGWVAHPSVLAEAAPQAATAGVLLRLADGADTGEALTRVQQLTEGEQLLVTGGAGSRHALTEQLDLLVLVTTALLGVAVLIALVGIGNTLALSVLERGREHALLRALGLARGQLRGALALEGVLLAFGSALLGTLLGVLYAWAGVRSVLPPDVAMTLALPVGQLGLVL
ncbi:FtsX-like permease family protein, partial [Ornithinicoccus halotolerans]|uniref:FtsX-like permease family protein n=1 Tax=Ornithinicoccus halotolerans TaxID=1748220 RepID=UPI001294E3CA